MRNTTIDTIEAHSPSRYSVLLCLGGGAIVWQHTAHLSVAVMGRGLSDRSVQMLNSFYPDARLPRRQAGLSGRQSGRCQVTTLLRASGLDGRTYAIASGG